MTVEIPEQLEAALKAQAVAQAVARGVSAEGYVREVLEQTLARTSDPEDDGPFETGRGMLAKYGRAPTEEKINENRSDMFRNFAAGVE